MYWESKQLKKEFDHYSVSFMPMRQVLQEEYRK